MFLSKKLNNGWSLEATPVIQYDWEAVSNNRLMLPVGGGIGKRFGKWQFRTEVHYYIISPDRFGPEWLIKFGIRR